MEALDKKSPEKTQEEMGDLIFLLLFCAEIARDEGDFSIEDVFENVKKKMVGRHPHVFEGRKVNDISEIKENWKEIKEKEKVVASQRTLQEKLPRHLPVLLQAYWVSRKVNEMSNDDQRSPVARIEKITKIIQEVKEHLTPKNYEVTKRRLGDLLFNLVGLSVSLKINPEGALKEALQRFLEGFKSTGKAKEF
jgi:tetrapyrrole methylase family protein/MazG family protein